MKMDDSSYLKWYNEEATEEERKMHNRLNSFDNFFEDMRFEPDTSSYHLIQCQSKPEGSDVWEECEVPLPDELKYFSYNYFKVKIVEMKNYSGYYDPSEQLICLTPNAIDSTIIHELIHVHESIINELPLYYHDMLLWSLYQDLKKRVDGLDAAISQHAHLLNESSLASRGGTHDILFLLKSFDLDIKQKCPFGTIFGYGRKNDFKHLRLKEV